LESPEESMLLPCIATQYQEHVRPIIDLIDRLRFLGVDQDVSLPSIVVVGDQSSGKSSVLEALSGVQLPRGSGRPWLIKETSNCTGILQKNV
jgi:GTP-binding protein EngB required for normal cell division